MFWLDIISSWKKGCLTLIALFFLIITIVIKCEHKKTDEFNKLNSQLLAQCEAACDANDFEKAYNVLGTIRASFTHQETYNKAKKIIFEKEVTYLVSVNSEDASNRIAYLLTENLQLSPRPMPEGTYENLEVYELDNYNNEITKSNEFCNKIFHLAASQGNKYLCKKLLFFYREEAVYKKLGTDNSEESQKETEDNNDQKVTYIVSYEDSAKETAIEKYKDFFGEEPDLKQDNIKE